MTCKVGQKVSVYHDLVKGMLVRVYRNAEGPDCTGDGVSSKHTRFVLIGKNVPEIFAPSDDAPALYLHENVPGHIRAVPSLDDGKWYMDGGNFIASSDSRMPQRVIPIHDRVE